MGHLVRACWGVSRRRARSQTGTAGTVLPLGQMVGAAWTFVMIRQSLVASSSCDHRLFPSRAHQGFLQGLSFFFRLLSSPWS